MSTRFWVLWLGMWAAMLLAFPVFVVAWTRYANWIGCVVGGVCR